MDFEYKRITGQDNPNPVIDSCCYKLTALDDNPTSSREADYDISGYPTTIAGGSRYMCDEDVEY